MESLQRSSVFAVHGASAQAEGAAGRKSWEDRTKNGCLLLHKLQGGGACPSQAGFANSKIGGQVCYSDSQSWCVGVASADRLGWQFHEAGF